MRQFTGQISLAAGHHERDVGLLFLLMREGIDLVDGSTWQAGQGDTPTADEQDRMEDAAIRLPQVAREIYKGLVGSYPRDDTGKFKAVLQKVWKWQKSIKDEMPPELCTEIKELLGIK